MLNDRFAGDAQLAGGLSQALALLEAQRHTGLEGEERDGARSADRELLPVVLGSYLVRVCYVLPLGHGRTTAWA